MAIQSRIICFNHTKCSTSLETTVWVCIDKDVIVDCTINLRMKQKYLKLNLFNSYTTVVPSLFLLVSWHDEDKVQLLREYKHDLWKVRIEISQLFSSLRLCFECSKICSKLSQEKISRLYRIAYFYKNIQKRFYSIHIVKTRSLPWKRSCILSVYNS